MINHVDPIDPSADRLVSSLPLESLIRMAASNHAAIEGLQAIASEVGGRDGTKIMAVAERLRLGGSNSGQYAFGHQAVPILQAAAQQRAEGSTASISTRLPRWVMLAEQRTQVLTRLNRLVVVGLLYALIASAIGLGIQKIGMNFSDELGLATARFWLLGGAVDVKEGIFLIDIGSLVVTTLLLLSWLFLTGFGRQSGEFFSWLNPVFRINESFWNLVPLVGSTYRSIHLAQMSESIAQSLSVGWTFSQAMHAAADQTRSAVLRKWLLSSEARLDRGESPGTILASCPLGAYWLRAMSQVLSQQRTEHEMAQQWRLVSDNLHVLTLRRVQRAAAALLPATVLFSASILLIAWASLVVQMFELISGIL